MTVTAVSNETLNDFGVDNLFKLADLVPGMVFSRAPDDGLALTLRGLGTPARTQSFDQSVALFLDGMFLGKGRMYSSAFFDVERVEVIKGTQSTLLGKNTSLGAISLTTTKPGTRSSAATYQVAGRIRERRLECRRCDRSFHCHRRSRGSPGRTLCRPGWLGQEHPDR